jgi:uncharacterized protein (TIGR00369 family)
LGYGGAMTKKTPTEPIPTGWTLRAFPESFGGVAGPFYFRDDGAPGVGFFSEPRHGNLGGVVHGGALLTLADMALFNICRDELAASRAVTVTLSSEFIAAAPIGQFIEATGDMVRAGRSLLFARGLISADEKPVLAFSGTLKRVS